MLKKALQAAATFGLLVAGYQGYVRGFAIVAAKVERDAAESPYKLVSVARHRGFPHGGGGRALAAEAFGKSHWSRPQPGQGPLHQRHEPGLLVLCRRIYPRGGGAPRHLLPLRDGRDVQGPQGVQDDQRSAGDPRLRRALRLRQTRRQAAHVVHARINDEVNIRDNRGTPKAAADDLLIGPMTYVEYDERDLQIRSTSPVALQRPQHAHEGDGLLMELRPPGGRGQRGPSAGSTGCGSIWVKKDIRIHMDDAGKSGILPIDRRRHGPGQGQGRRRAKTKTPLDLDGEGPMRITCPSPSSPCPSAPPPTGPTLARFEHDVRVRRGAEKPAAVEQRHLAPDPRPRREGRYASATPAPTRADPVGRGGIRGGRGGRAAVGPGPAAGRRRRACGLAPVGVRRDLKVLLQPARPREARRRPARRDLSARATRGRSSTWRRKTSSPRARTRGRSGPSRSWRRSTRPSTRTAPGARGSSPGGPAGWSRGPDRNQPVEREASWQDQLVMETKPQDVDDHRIVTLTGTPKLKSPTQGSLTRSIKIIYASSPSRSPPPTPRRPRPWPSPARHGDGLDDRRLPHPVAPGLPRRPHGLRPARRRPRSRRLKSSPTARPRRPRPGQADDARQGMAVREVRGPARRRPPPRPRRRADPASPPVAAPDEVATPRPPSPPTRGPTDGEARPSRSRPSPTWTSTPARSGHASSSAPARRRPRCARSASART